MNDGLKALPHCPDGGNHTAQSPVIRSSILFPYVDTRGINAIKDRSKAFEAAVVAFCNETKTAFTVYKRGASDGTSRYEAMKPFIIKVLLYVGLDPRSAAFGIVSRIIEARAARPELDLKHILSEIAGFSGRSYEALDRIVEKSFDIYDDSVIERVKFLTDTEPMNAKDVINDLAIYVRAKYTIEAARHA